MSKKIIVLIVLMVLGIGFAQEVSRDSLERMLERAKFYYSNGEYESSISELENALKYLKEFKQGDKVEAYKYLAFSYVAFGNNKEAKEQFKNALRLNPKLKLDPATVSPKIIKVFEEAKSEIAKEPKPPKPPKPPTVSEGPSTIGSTWRSCILPGWGQMYKGDGSKGKKIMIASGATLGLTLVSLVIEDAAHQNYLDVGLGDQDLMDSRYKTYKLWHNIRAYSFISFSVVYLYNIGDAILSKPKTGNSMIDLDNGLYCDFNKDYFRVGYNINF